MKAIQFVRPLTLALVALLAGCATNRGSTPEPDVPAAPLVRWPVQELRHVDLWLHGFAMVSTDTAIVPLYQRGYREAMTVTRNAANITTSLDANRETLAKGMNAGYLQAQFFAFEYDSWESMNRVITRFLESGGNPQAVGDRVMAAHVAMFAGVFRTAADREWLRLFRLSLDEEATRFYTAHRAQLWRERNAVVTTIDSLWQQEYRTKFDRFLANTGQRNGEIVLSAPIGGEGRTLTRDGRTTVAVAFPARQSDAAHALLVFAHEITGGIVGSVVSDHTSPVEQRAGIADKYIAIGQVRTGAMALQKVAPELVSEYVRYYLVQAGKPADTSIDALARHFPLPEPIVASLQSQVEIVLGGI